MSEPLAIPKDALVYVALGGAGEIGMNLYLYGIAGKWLMVDCGIGFGDDSMPAVDVVMADPSFIAERRKDLVGLVLTHGHEDHLGAVAWLWPQLRCPVFATPFTAALLESKLEETGLVGRTPVTVVELGGRVSLPPFDIEFVSLTHSIPEPNALAIRTAAGLVVHTGDWKFDPDPVVGRLPDFDALHRLGDEGVLALVGDSTNVLTPGTSGSEATARAALTEVLATPHRRIAVTCFASNVARLNSIAAAAQANGRHCALVGRSLWRVVEAAKRTGYIDPAAQFFTDDELGYLPPEETVYICTGSQGEARSALARIAWKSHPHVALGRGDVVVFSSRVIPGNEKAIFKLQNKLIGAGVRLITSREAQVHVSGHPAREEMERMYALLRPKVSVPIHGETRHLIAHAALGEACGAAHSVVAENGTVARLGPGTPEAIGTVPTGRLALDGYRVVALDSLALRERKRMLFNGSAVVTVVVDRGGVLVREPQVTIAGVLDGEEGADDLDEVVAAVRGAVGRLPTGSRRDDEAVREAARLAVRRTIKDIHGKKPVTEVHLVRI